jgi:hypothetical protein
MGDFVSDGADVSHAAVRDLNAEINCTFGVPILNGERD